jgi:RsiW-degrading membrane proteinase PrsW (M82 family)
LNNLGDALTHCQRTLYCLTNALGFVSQLLGTFLQPILILYFVHWFWNRLDISIDALIKLFASGFFICTSIAILYEVLVSMVASIAVFVVGGFGSLILLLTGEIQIDLADDADDDGDSETSNLNIRTAYIIAIALLSAFLDAFLVAALVEEIGKYLCFWMVEHPDLEDDVVLDNGANSSTSRPTKEERELLPQDDPMETKVPITRPAVTLTSRGAAITIAMVTTALGFACAENLLYVFVYTQPGIAAEISTLIVRCMLPVHPLAAALQSIGVCRRDLERDPSSQVGRIIFPAWLLHGFFDFTLMSYTVVTQVLEKQNSSAADDEAAERGAEDDDSVDPIEDLESSIVILCVVFSIPLLGLVYYFKEAWEQRKRLKELDSRNENIGVLVS